jgi:hypothetical protein
MVRHKGGFLNIFVRYKDTSDDKVDVALTKLKCYRTLIAPRQLISSRNTASCLEVTMNRWASPRASATKILRSWQSHPEANFLKQAEQFEDDYDNNNYSDYVEDASVHAETDIRLSLRWPAFIQNEAVFTALAAGFILGLISALIAPRLSVA